MKYDNFNKLLLKDKQDIESIGDISTGYVIFDQKFRICSSDTTFAQHFSLTPQQLAGVSIKALVREESRCAFDFGMQILQKNGAFKVNGLRFLNGSNASFFEFRGERFTFENRDFTLGYIMELSK